MSTLRNETEERNLDWRPVESKMLAAAAYDAPPRRLWLRFNSGDVYRYLTFPAEQYQVFLAAESQGQYFLGHIRNCFPYEHLPRR